MVAERDTVITTEFDYPRPIYYSASGPFTISSDPNLPKSAQDPIKISEYFDLI